MSHISWTLPIVFKWLNYKILKFERDSLGQDGDILWLVEFDVEEERVTFLWKRQTEYIVIKYLNLNILS